MKPELYKAIFDMDRIFDEIIKAVKDVKFSPICPECGGDDVAKYGRTQYGKQRWKCKNCGVVFTVSKRYHDRLRMIEDAEEEEDMDEVMEEEMRA